MQNYRNNRNILKVAKKVNIIGNKGYLNAIYCDLITPKQINDTYCELIHTNIVIYYILIWQSQE